MDCFVCVCVCVCVCVYVCVCVWTNVVDICYHYYLLLFQVSCADIDIVTALVVLLQ